MQARTAVTIKRPVEEVYAFWRDFTNLPSFMYHLASVAGSKVVAKLFGEEPQQQISDDLRRLKQVLETGEVVVSEGSPEGTRTARLLKQRPAEPVS